MKEAVKIFCAFKRQKKGTKQSLLPAWATAERQGVLRQALKNTKHLLTDDKQDTHAAVPSK